MRKLALSLTIGWVVGCERAPASMPSVTRVDSAGIEIVTSTEVDRALPWEFESLLRLGGADAGTQSFHRVPSHGLAFDSSGSVFVLDIGNRQLHVFDRGGGQLRTIGREGRGPGEFQYPSSFAVEAGGDVLVHDFGQRAIIRFDSTGSFVEQFPAPPAISGPIRLRVPALIYAARQQKAEAGPTVLAIHRAEPTDTIQIAAVEIHPSKTVVYESCGFSIALPPLFANPPSWDARAGRVALAAASDYAVRVIDESGSARIIRRRFQPEVATDAHAALELGEGEEWSVGGRPCVVPPEEAIEKRGIADSIPMLEDIAIDPDGWVWVKRFVVGADSGAVDVFNATGEYVGTLPPETPWPVAFGPGGTIASLERDDLDVQRAVIYRIARD